MGLLLNSSTPLSLWQNIIHEAERSCRTPLQTELEAYLVFLMVRFTNRPEMVKQIMATEFITGLNLGPHHKQTVLQQVGDKCLIYTGLFPHRAEKKLVKISYFVNLGQSAYLNISNNTNDIYGLLSKHFVALMDILQSLRLVANHSLDLLPLEAYELWMDTGSKRALSILKEYTTDKNPNMINLQEKLPNR